jgi:hypothetical protein
MMPTAANIGETWKISSMVVSYTDNTTESYAKGIGEFLEIDGNDAVIVDYAELKFSSNEVPINGKLPIEIDIPNVPNPYFVTLWLRNSTNDNVNASVMDYNSNPYIVISTKDTGEKVSVGDTYRLVGASVGVQNSGGEMQYLYYGADKSTNIMGEYIYSTNLIIEGTDSLKIMYGIDYHSSPIVKSQSVISVSAGAVPTSSKSSAAKTATPSSSSICSLTFSIMVPAAVPPDTLLWLPIFEAVTETTCIKFTRLSILFTSITALGSPQILASTDRSASSPIAIAIFKAT